MCKKSGFTSAEIEEINPEGRLEIVTVGIDVAPLRLCKGDCEDIITPMDMGPLKQGCPGVDRDPAGWLNQPS